MFIVLFTMLLSADTSSKVPVPVLQTKSTINKTDPYQVIYEETLAHPRYHTKNSIEMLWGGGAAGNYGPAPLVTQIYKERRKKDDLNHIEYTYARSLEDTSQPESLKKIPDNVLKQPFFRIDWGSVRLMQDKPWIDIFHSKKIQQKDENGRIVERIGFTVGPDNKKIWLDFTSLVTDENGQEWVLSWVPKNDESYIHWDEETQSWYASNCGRSKQPSSLRESNAKNSKEKTTVIHKNSETELESSPAPAAISSLPATVISSEM